MNQKRTNGYNFIDRDKLYDFVNRKTASKNEISEILDKSLKLKGLTIEDVSKLLQINDEELYQKLLKSAGYVKNEIYGRRLVLFAPLYIGNYCSNNCLYCAFRKDNKSIDRALLSMDQIKMETESLLKEGHKRLLMLQGETKGDSFNYFLEAIRAAYSVKVGNSSIRRINVEVAPVEVDDFARLKKEKIGTYVCFQETYDSELYKVYHPEGPKADFEYRLNVMDRAMAGGIDDVGIGALFGLADYRFEVLAMMEHASHLEKEFGCGPHTVSVPRIEPAEGVPLTNNIPHPVSDYDFKKLVAIFRIALPYTGIILSTRENESLREELFNYGVSQISAGSRTNPGAYSDKGTHSGSQFSLGDHRNLDEIISSLIDKEFIPSFCTGCYRKGRVGADFMDLAKPGLIKEFCMPNAVFTFKEYLEDFAHKETKDKGLNLIEKLVNNVANDKLKNNMNDIITKIGSGQRDLYF